MEPFWIYRYLWDFWVLLGAVDRMLSTQKMSILMWLPLYTDSKMMVEVTLSCCWFSLLASTMVGCSWCREAWACPTRSTVATWNSELLLNTALPPLHKANIFCILYVSSGVQWFGLLDKVVEISELVSIRAAVFVVRLPCRLYFALWKYLVTWFVTSM